MNMDHLKEKLEEELHTVNKELGELGSPNIDHTATETDEVADRFEDQEEADSEKAALESRKIEIEAALNRIEIGSYGKCRECQADIEEERLEANPAATTCATHAA